MSGMTATEKDSHYILSETKNLVEPWNVSPWAQILRRWLRMTHSSIIYAELLIFVIPPPVDSGDSSETTTLSAWRF
jgi:hypothetical protein